MIKTIENETKENKSLLKLQKILVHFVISPFCLFNLKIYLVF